MTKRSVMTLLVAGAAALIAGSAQAGWKGQGYAVAAHYSDGSSFGGGQFATVRATPNDNTSELFCYLTNSYAACAAYMANGTGASCTTQDPNLIALIRSFNSDAWINFYSDATGKCTSISSYNDSGYAPKTP